MTSPPPVAATAAPCSSAGAWTRRRLWVFRTGVALFAIAIAAALLDASDGTRAVGAAMSNAVRAAGAAVLPDVVAALDAFAARSDGHATALQLVRDGVLAVWLGALWMLCDRRRQHARLAGAVRLCLRYLVAVVMLIYGGLKVVPVQFPVPSAEELLRPLGDRTPMRLLWAFMGASPAYTVFAGLGESLGGVLLFWRRTTTLGALLLAGVLSNVVMLNFAYDVPVKRGSALLLLASLVLASRDARRLLAVLVLDEPAAPRREPPFAGGRVARRVRAVLKPAIVLLAVAGPMVVAVFFGPPRAGVVPLQGVYAVERFVRDGVEVAPLLTETGRWRRLVLGDRGGAVVQTMDDRFERYGLAIDEAAGTVTLTRGPSGPVLRFRYEGSSGQPLRFVAGEQGIQEVGLRPLAPASVFRVLR